MDAKEKKVFNSRPLFYGFIVLLIALASARNIFVGKTSYVILFFVVVLALMIYFFWAKKYVMLIFILGMFLFGLGWYYVGYSTYLGKTYDTECVVTGRVTDKLNNNTYSQTTTLHDKNKNVIIKQINKMSIVSSGRYSFVDAKNPAIFKITSNPNPHTLSKMPKLGIPALMSVSTNKSGNKIEKSGTTIRLTKNERQFSELNISPKNGEIPIEVEIEIEKASAILFGKNFLKNFNKTGLIT